jgi:hypothetical protein
MSRSSRPLAAAFALALAVAAAPALGAFRCDSTTALTLVGLDTAAGRAVFALPISTGAPTWLVEADLVAGTARGWQEAASASSRFGGSTGPGPVLAATRCGAQCVQVVRFRGGVWERAGEPLLASQASTLDLTWDRAGSPWAVLHTMGKKGAVTATAYRLENGDWVSKGALVVHGVGSPGAVAAPAGEVGVTSGDGSFTPSAKPRTWVSSFPSGAGGGEPIWLGGSRALYVAADGIRSTADGGASWQPLRWQALSEGEGDYSWRAGRDYVVELPDGERTQPAAAVWGDRRIADRGRLVLAAQGDDGGWHALARLPDGVLTEGGERLAFNHLLRFAGERWALLTGCVSRPGGAALVVRRLAAGKLGGPEVLKIELPSVE